MKNLFNLGVLLILILLSSNLYSQNFMRQIDESGFNLGAQFTSIEGGSIFGLLPSYTINGKIDIGLGIGTESIDAFDESGTTIAPFVNYLVIRQGENDMPISVNLGGSYQYTTYGDLDITGSIARIQASAIYNYAASEKFNLIPAFTLGYINTNIDISGLGDASVSDVGYGISVTGLIDKFWISPSLSFVDGDSQFSTSLGYLF